MEARLSVSIRDNDALAVKRLLDRGADLKAFNRKGFASIHVACAHDSDRVLDILLQRNPLLALEPAKDKSLPVEVAITHGSTGCLHVLAQHKLLFNPTYTTNNSAPLTLALTASNLSPSQRLATVATLTGLGANVNEPVCPYMMTPLMIAIVQDTGIPIVSFLLKNGASTTVSDLSGETALHKAIKYHFYSYYMILAEEGARVDDAMMDTCMRTDSFAAEVCVFMGGQVTEEMTQIAMQKEPWIFGRRNVESLQQTFAHSHAIRRSSLLALVQE